MDLRTICAQRGVVPRGVIHAGAHEGQEVSEYLAMGMRRILLIEANPDVFARLSSAIQGIQQALAVQCAVCDRDGTVTLRVASNDQSSSILPMKLHREHYPNIAETGQIAVPCRRLDTLLPELKLSASEFNVLHLDIQGAELLALHGAEKTLEHIEVIRSEFNLAELYEGCPLLADLDAFLSSHGFERAGSERLYHPSWGDAVYVRRKAHTGGGLLTMSTLGHNGRFGNQLLQYAFLRIYAQMHNLDVQTPPWIGQKLFGHDDPPITQALPSFRDEANLPTLPPALAGPEPLRDVDLWGYFQFHTSFYRAHKDFFRSLFQPLPEIERVARDAWDKLRSRGQTIVGLHVRMGDYNDPKIPHHLIASPELYKKFLREIWKTRPDPVLFIASDEVEKVRRDFAEFNPVTIDDLGVRLSDADFYPDFYLLSRCHVLMISNSTFSFLAAMLSEGGQLFVRPTFERTLAPFDPWDSEILLFPPAEVLAAKPNVYADTRTRVLFFSSAFNNESYFRQQIEQLKTLPFFWRWHIVEGATASTANNAHRDGRSTDGTSEFVDHLARIYPDVHVLRKPPGQLWSGTAEMFSAALGNIGIECLLWHLEPGELWTTDQIVALREMFLSQPQRTAAVFDRTNSLGTPEPTVRVWRFRPGMRWANQEPPVLAEPTPQGPWRNIAPLAPFLPHELQGIGPSRQSC